jgi:hypothetical protein
MNKLANFALRVREAGRYSALEKIANPVAAEAGLLARAIPKTRLGRLGALGAIGAGAYALGNRKEESVLDKANHYINNIDPATLNTALGLYGQLSNPNSMGYYSDPSMGVNYSDNPAGMGLDEEYLTDLEKTSAVKLSNSKYWNYLKGALMGMGSAAGATGLAKGIRGVSDLSNPDLFIKGLGNIENMGLSGMALGGGIGATAAGLLASRAAKVKDAVGAASSSATKNLAKAVSQPQTAHEMAYRANYQRAFAPNNPYYMY